MSGFLVDQEGVVSPPASLVSSAPGRICLFGEHQDYLGLPVIASAIDLRVELRGSRRNGPKWRISLPDVGEEFSYDPNKPFAYRHDRDYLPAASNCILRQGISWPAGYDVEVKSTIPINGGASSSSALQIAWSAFLYAAAGSPRANDPHAVAMLAHQSEVLEFGSPGGMMDQFSSAFGGVVYLKTLPPYPVQTLPGFGGVILLIGSGQPKDTNGVLGRVRRPLERAGFVCTTKHDPFAEWEHRKLTSGNGSADESQAEDGALRRLIEGNLVNRRLTEAARELFDQGGPAMDRHDLERLGKLLSLHHTQLSKSLGVSTERIDSILANACEHGALGGKINGSGGGGTCFVLCEEEHTEGVCRVLDDMGAPYWRVRCGDGLRIEAYHDCQSD
ncbi:MAG: galactokinase family protein [Sumerlaeia bacterium]